MKNKNILRLYCLNYLKDLVHGTGAFQTSQTFKIVSSLGSFGRSNGRRDLRSKQDVAGRLILEFSESLFFFFFGFIMFYSFVLATYKDF